MAKSRIIKELASGHVDVDVALKQLKVLLSEFPDKEISAWVNKELSGYKNNNELPAYRKVSGTLRGSIMNYSVHAKNVGIPLSPDAPEVLQEYCNTVKFVEPIGVLRSMARNNGKEYCQTVSPNYYPLIMENTLLQMTAILDANIVFGTPTIERIVAIVENITLDVFLLLEKEFGCLDDLDIDFGSKSEDQIKDISSRINVYIYNDNSVSIGDENEITDSVIASGSMVEQ